MENEKQLDCSADSGGTEPWCKQTTIECLYSRRNQVRELIARTNNKLQALDAAIAACESNPELVSHFELLDAVL